MSEGAKEPVEDRERVDESPVLRFVIQLWVEQQILFVNVLIERVEHDGKTSEEDVVGGKCEGVEERRAREAREEGVEDLHEG